MQIHINARFLTQRITGVQRFAIELCKQLRLLDQSIQFVAPNNIIHHELAKELDVKIIGKKSGHLWEQLELPNYLKKHNNPVLLNLCNTAPIFYNRNFVTIHDLAVIDFPSAYSFQFRKFYQFLLPNIAKNALHVFTVSQFSKRRIKEEFKVDSTVIHNSVSDAFKQVNSQEKKNYILSVSSLDPKKNFKGLVNAFISAELSNYQLIVIGSENKSFKSQDIPVDQPNIIFTGYVSDQKLIELYQEATLFVYPSLYEGFGIPPLEAMACGCPTLVSDIPSLREVCMDASVFFDPKSPHDLSEKLIQVIADKNLQTDLKTKGLLNVNRFSWEKSANELTKYMEKFTNI